MDQNIKRQNRLPEIRNLLCAIFLFLNITATANPTSPQLIDSLFQLFEQKSSKELHLKAANALIDYMYQEKYATEKSTFSSASPSDSIDMLVYGYCGYYFYNTGANYDSIKGFVEKAIDASLRLKDTTQLSENLLLMGSISCRMGDHSNALEAFTDALDLSDHMKCLKTKSSALNNLGALYAQLNEDTVAIKYYKDAIEIERKMPPELRNGGKLAIRLSNLSELYLKQNMPVLAMPLILEALELDEKEGNDKKIAIRKSNLANTYRHFKDYKRAEKFYLEAVDAFKMFNMKNSLAIASSQMFELYREMDQPEKALARLKECLDISRAINFSYFESKACRELHEVYKTSDPALALSYLSRHVELKQKQYDADNNKRFNEFRVKYNTREKEHQIVLHETTIKRQKFKQMALYAVLTLSLIILILIYIVYLQQIKRNKTLAQANAEKDKLFSIISHDLKNPVLMQRQIMQQIIDDLETNNTHSLKEHISVLLQSTDAQIELLINLLNWTKIQAGRMIFCPIVFDLKPIIKETTDLVMLQLQEKELTLFNDISDDTLLFGDRLMISTVVRNLLTNAIKFSYPKGQIFISLLPLNEKKAQLIIRDEGVGLSKSQINNLFKIEKQSTTVGTAGEQGCGLGLIICKELIEKNGGDITVESEEKKGTSIIITLKRTDK